MSPRACPSASPRGTSAWRCRVVGGLVVLLLTLPALAQPRSALEEKRRALVADIARTDELLRSTKRTRAAELDRFLTLKQQIAARRALLATLRAEVSAVDASERRTLAVIDLLRTDVTRLRAEYARLLRAAYRQRRQRSHWLLLLSAGSLNQAYRRYRYLRQYEAYRRRQAQLLQDTQAMLSTKLRTLDARRVEKQALLAAQETQLARLATERDTRNRLLVSLGKDERRIAAELRTQRADRERLNGAIETLIRDQMADRRRRTTRPGSTPPSPAPAPAGATAPPVDAPLGNDFRRRRGRLAWPVANGVLTRGFGRRPHPTLPDIFVDNSGIDLRTPAAAPVRAVFAGEVVGVQFVPGMHYTVLVQHGDYYTVYSNLTAAAVAPGETVSAGHALGEVHTDPNTNGGTLHFELWQGRRKLDPTEWLR